jgi:hypothetical protein
MNPEFGPAEVTTPRSIEDGACLDLEERLSLVLGGLAGGTARSVGCRNAQLEPRLHVPLIKNLQTSVLAAEDALESDDETESAVEELVVVDDL